MKAALTVVAETSVNLTLPTAQRGVSIAWSSDHAAITASGVITRGDADVVVTLTATLTYAGKTDSKTFKVTVKAKELVDTTLADVKAALVLVLETQEDLVLPIEHTGVTISWASNNDAISTSGVITRGDADVEM